MCTKSMASAHSMDAKSELVLVLGAFRIRFTVADYCAVIFWTWYYPLTTPPPRISVEFIFVLLSFQ